MHGAAGGSVRRDSLEGWPASPQAAHTLEPSASPFAAQHLAGAAAAAAAQPFLRLRLATGPARGSAPSQDSHEPADDAAAALRGDWRGSPGGSEQGAEPCHGQGEDASGGASRRGSGSNAGSGWSGDTGGGLESLVATAKVLRVWVEPAALALRPACLMRLGSVLGGRPDSGAESLGTLALQAANRLASRAARAAAKAQLVLKPDAPLALDMQARCPWECVLRSLGSHAVPMERLSAFSWAGKVAAPPVLTCVSEPGEIYGLETYLGHRTLADASRAAPAQVRDIVVELPCECPGEGPAGAAQSVVLRTDTLVLRSLPPGAAFDLGGPVNGDGAAAALEDLETRLRGGAGVPEELDAAAEEVGRKWPLHARLKP